MIGGNGAGKSTMLNAVAGVWPVDEGTIEIGEMCIRDSTHAGSGKEPDRIKR